MCQVFQKQGEQLEALKAEVAALRKQVAAISAKAAKVGK
jgi:hypothetical protein